ncbi:tetratricopeptide repeat protein [Brachybacterium sp. EF45031]|uniref:co-chaperone YbbN n=1 Tax=Brachybacterium sillae TaxID=2810536 RepID=UPI00217ECFC6|nr:tetratricopeptide repeat protein [Brachybacterium sillae]MCS6710905.1 tetratricopeptide repeat protein [Brachybacterium sillae]
MTDPYGVIDLASLKQSPGEGASAGAGAHEVQVTEASLQEVIAGSSRVATLMVVTSTRVPGGEEFLAALRRAVEAKNGAITLATVDADAQPRVAAALQVQQLPTVLLLLQGQLQPLFEGPVPEPQLMQLMDQVVQVAQQQGLSGAADGESAPAEPPLSPQMQAAQDAAERGDYDGAIAAYQEMLTANPADAEAKAGLATVRLLQRTEGVDLDAARGAAASAPKSLAAQMLVADLDLLGGHVEDAFARLLDLMRGVDAESKDALRARLLELFEVVGAEDPRVGPARRRLASLLY